MENLYLKKIYLLWQCIDRIAAAREVMSRVSALELENGMPEHATETYDVWTFELAKLEREAAGEVEAIMPLLTNVELHLLKKGKP